MPEFDGEVDRYANDLIERFRDLMPASALDASGEGLFVDAAGGLTGLAGRIEVNAAVDPSEAGGAVWRLRDGLSATAPGNTGNGSDPAVADRRDGDDPRPDRLRLAERQGRQRHHGSGDRVASSPAAARAATTTRRT